jgi:hypothetical protein
MILWSDSSGLSTTKGASRLLGQVYSIVLAKGLPPCKTSVKTVNLGGASLLLL